MGAFGPVRNDVLIPPIGDPGIRGVVYRINGASGPNILRISAG
jgi:hypothetical protein